ncbi:hypothetical protein D3C77_672230 [compost metagenome]
MNIFKYSLAFIVTSMADQSLISTSSSRDWLELVTIQFRCYAVTVIENMRSLLIINFVAYL